MSTAIKRSNHSQALLDVNLQKADKPWENSLLVSSENDDTVDTVKAKPSMMPLPGRCSALSKVKDFLPQLKCANKELFDKLQQNPSSAKDIDIENTEGNTNVIEMDVSVVEDLKQTAIDQLLGELSDSDSSDDDDDV